jgi:large subunit ribosomal protein L5
MKTAETKPYVPRLIVRYRNEIVPAMMKEFGYQNMNQVPRLEKIVLNMGVKEGAVDVKILEAVSGDLATITGQKPLVTRARKSISAFKLREGSPIGLKVTLRGPRMYEFLDRLINVAIPRIRDFRGFPASGFDGEGNLNIGLNEQIIFPEVEYDKIKKIQGMNITFVTTTAKKAESKRLMEHLGFPFRK